MSNHSSVAESITNKLTAALQPEHLELVNESHMHAGPATDSHFNLVLVSQHFAELNKVRRHQAVYRILAEEMATQVHALALHLYSPEEWDNSKQEFHKSPRCSGKNI